MRRDTLATAPTETRLDSRSESADRAVILNIARSYVGKVRQYQTAVQIVEGFRSDRELLSRALREHTEAWRLLHVAAPILRRDRELMHLALSHPSGQGWRALATPHAPLEVRSDPVIGMEAIQLSAGIALQYLAPALRDDPDFISEALRTQFEEADHYKEAAAAPQGPSWQTLLEHCRHLSGGKPPRAAARRHPRNLPAPRRLTARTAGGVKLMQKLENDAMFVHKNQARRGSARMVGEWVEEKTGTEVRIVPVVAIQLQRPDGLAFVQVGKVENGIPKPECFLPGGKIKADEMPDEAMQRIVTENLLPIRDGIVTGETDFMYDQRVSSSTGMPSRYLRLVTKATLREDFEIASCLQQVRVSKINLNARGGVPRPRAPRGHSGLAQRYNMRQGSHAPDIFALLGDPNRKKGLVPLYAWLPVWEFERLRSATDAKATISVWLGDLDIGPFVSESWEAGVKLGCVAAPGLSVRGLRDTIVAVPKTESEQEGSEHEDNNDDDEDEEGQEKQKESGEEDFEDEEDVEEGIEDEEDVEEEAEEKEEAARSSGSLEVVLREALKDEGHTGDRGGSDGEASKT